MFATEYCVCIYIYISFLHILGGRGSRVFNLKSLFLWSIPRSRKEVIMSDYHPSLFSSCYASPFSILPYFPLRVFNCSVEYNVGINNHFYISKCFGTDDIRHRVLEGNAISRKRKALNDFIFTILRTSLSDLSTVILAIMYRSENCL
jgi:hypothetical protein